MVTIAAARTGIRQNTFRAFDTFTRADSVVTMGSTQQGGGAWTSLVGTWGILSNQAYSVTAADGDLVSVDIGASDVDVTVLLGIMAAHSTFYGVCARMINSNNYYKLECSAETFLLAKVVAGVETVLAQTPRTIVSNPTVRLKIVGSSLSSYLNGTLISSVTDASLTSGTRIGFRYGVVGTPAMRFDNFVVIA